MSDNAANLLYLVASVLFILTLRGLSAPGSARRGNMFGIAGMVLAIAATLALPGMESYLAIAIVALLGAGVGAAIALRVSMTALPQLIAVFHSLVGLAAVLVAGAAFFAPNRFGLLAGDVIRTGSLIEMAIGTVIGGVTFTASLVAFTKLQGLVSGDAVTFRLQPQAESGVGARIGGVGRLDGAHATAGGHVAAGDRGFHPRCHADHTDWRGGYAGRDLDVEFILGLGGVRHRVHVGE